MKARAMLRPLWWAGILLPVVLLVVSAAAARAQGGDNRVALVVRYEDGTVETKCISFSEPTLTGEELLQRSGLTAVIDYNALAGGAVCSIQGLGCSVQDCFCRCQGADCRYWAYYHWVDGSWQYSQVGATGSQIKDGAIEGWSWGPGNFVSGTEPPVVKFEEICTDETALSATVAPEGYSGAAGSAPWLQYAGFAAAVLLLLGAGILVARRQSR
jgi:hypothetical protein